MTKFQHFEHTAELEVSATPVERNGFEITLVGQRFNYMLQLKTPAPSTTPATEGEMCAISQAALSRDKPQGADTPAGDVDASRLWEHA